MRRRRSRERGQIVPLMALLFVVLTGFAALTIDAGIGYDTSRNDQDVADAAALAASYWIYQNGSATGSLTGAYTAAEGVANLDCINPAGPCLLPHRLFDVPEFLGSRHHHERWVHRFMHAPIQLGSLCQGRRHRHFAEVSRRANVGRRQRVPSPGERRRRGR